VRTKRDLGWVLAKAVLGDITAAQHHYPCQCHDWVLKEDG